MKKVWMIVALAALSGLAASTFADVQNIRLSGDIRVRGYFLNGTGNNSAVQNASDVQFIDQRTRISVEADLEDHVMAVVTLQADGIWGDKASAVSSTAHPVGNNAWAIGVNEAYVQLRELFYSPATLKVGRQYLNYGSGLIISSSDLASYNFDAGRLILDYHPLTIELVAGQLVNNQKVSNTPSAAPRAGQSDLLFLNAKYEVGNSVVKDVEAYFGWASQCGPNMAAGVGPGTNGASPMVVGLRTDLTPVENLTASLEGVYEAGDAGAGAGAVYGANQISAFLAKAAATYTFKGVAWNPAINAAYTFASGGGSGGRHNFMPWFDAADNGVLFGPTLSNIQIINLGASVKPSANTSLAVEGYYYLKTDKNVGVSGNPNFDVGGLSYMASGSSVIPAGGAREIGWEVDTILGYDYSKDVRAQLVYAAFIPDNAIHNVSGYDRVANEIRGEINVRF